MNDKEAIDILKGWLDYNKRNKNILREADKIIEVQETVLNLLQTQQEEIETYKDMKAIANLEIREVLSWKNEIKRLNAELEKKDTLINTMQAEFERLEDLEDNTDMLKLELQKKDKIIDEMAKYIASLDIEEDICKNVENPCENYAGENRKLCNDCIKAYFINKLEKENKDE